MMLNFGVGWLCISSGHFVVKVNVFLASDDFIDVTTLTQMDYMIMDSEEMR